MSFGFGVGDFLSVGKLVWDVHSAYADAPEQFWNFSQEILSLHFMFAQLEDQLNKMTTFSAKQTQNLKTLYDELTGIMEELDALLKKYQSLLENPTISFDQVKWGQEDLVGLRERLRSNITLLTTFNASLANCQLIRAQEQLGQLLVAGGLCHRGSVASLHSIASFARSIDQRESWKELCREMHCNGITAEIMEAKKEEIFKLFRATGILSLSSNPDEEGVLQGHETSSRQDKQGKEQEQKNVASRLVVGQRARVLASPLHIAATNGRSSEVKVLLDRGANVDATNDNGWTALHQAACGGHIEVVKVLLDRGATINVNTTRNWTALHDAARGGHIEVVKVLLDRGATIDAMVDSQGTALHFAANRGCIEVVKVLLDRGANIDAMINSQWTALHYAAGKGNIEVVKVLLDRGATININTTTNGNLTALHYAACEGNIEVVKVLLDRGTAININTTTNENWTALHFAASEGHIEVVKVLLDRGASLNTTNNWGRTALHEACICAAIWRPTASTIEVVKVLLERSTISMYTIIDVTDQSGDTALHCATRGISHLCAPIVRLLLDHGANTNHRNTAGETALDIVRQFGWKGRLRMLKEYTRLLIRCYLPYN